MVPQEKPRPPRRVAGAQKFSRKPRGMISRPLNANANWRACHRRPRGNLKTNAGKPWAKTDPFFLKASVERGPLDDLP
jgi:hypothetical protein